MKQFKDLEFKPHTTGSGTQGLSFFKNGYGVSVVRFELMGGFGYGSYTANEDEWELAILFGNKDGYELTYNTGITEDVIGNLSENEVSEVMLKVQQL